MFAWNKTCYKTGCNSTQDITVFILHVDLKLGGKELNHVSVYCCIGLYSGGTGDIVGTLRLYLGCGFEIGCQQIKDLAFVCP